MIFYSRILFFLIFSFLFGVKGMAQVTTEPAIPNAGDTVKLIYDASKGTILLGTREGNFNFLNDSSYFNNKEAKAISKIVIGNRPHFIILNKNNTLKILKLK